MNSLSVWWRKSDTNNLFIACIYIETDTIIGCQLTMMLKICWMVKNCSQLLHSFFGIIGLSSSGFFKYNHFKGEQVICDKIWKMRIVFLRPSVHIYGFLACPKDLWVIHTFAFIEWPEIASNRFFDLKIAQKAPV